MLQDTDTLPQEWRKACQVEAEKEIETKKALCDGSWILDIKEYSRITKDYCWIDFFLSRIYQHILAWKLIISGLTRAQGPTLRIQL